MASIRLKEPYAPNLSMPETGGRFLNTGKNYPPQMRYKDLEYRKAKNPGYAVILNGAEPCTGSVASARQNRVFYFDTEQAKRCKVIEMEEVKLLRETVFLGCTNVQHVGGG